MKPIGRYQWRVRTLLLFPVLVALSWCLAVQAVEWGLLREDHRARAAQHSKEALSAQTFADSPIPAAHVAYAMGLEGTSRRCSRYETPLSEAEKAEARRLRERAHRLAAHHRSLRRKYALASWLPFLPLAPEPPLPE
jgi:hypothetical protein